MAAPPPHKMTKSELESPPSPLLAVTALDVPAALVVSTVDVLTAASELNSKEGGGIMRYLDVRTEEEMAKGHLHGALNVPYFFLTPQGAREKNPEFVEQVAALFTRDQHILVGCQSGKRSELACVDLLAAGFMNVRNVEGGYAGWVQNGLPVIVSGSHTTPESAAESVSISVSSVVATHHTPVSGAAAAVHTPPESAAAAT